MTMQTPDDVRRDLPPDLDRAASERLVAVAFRLQAKVPAPTPGFRGKLRRKLVGTSGDRRAWGQGPRAPRSLAVACASSGLLLLAIAAAGLVGAGPFAAG